ncbi:MAG: TolC family protein [Sandarakinorhabdus sp.]|nr:TolC family protein [Sandarakinorhabdus sp.]
MLLRLYPRIVTTSRLPLILAAFCASGSPTAVFAAPPLPSAQDFTKTGLRAPDCTADIAVERPLGLVELVDLALCRAPATRAAWASVQSEAARLAQTRAAYGPRIDATLSPEANFRRASGGGFPASDDMAASAFARLSINWILFDFGGREALLSMAEASRAAALAGFADQAQAIVLETALAYNGLLETIAAETAARSNLDFAEVSLKAAAAREQAGVGIRSDRLQADAAAAQALLQLRQAQGQALTARGRLATAISLPPTMRLQLAPPAPLGAADALLKSAEDLIAEADRLRPDLQLRSAGRDIAMAGVRSAEAARRPNLSLGLGPLLSTGTTGQDVASASAGLTLSIPLFDSGGRTWAVREARSEAERAEAQLQAARQSAALDVWSRYQALATLAANLDTARRLLASAEEAASLAQGRYRSGVATITELMNAQASLASARQQLVAAEFGARSGEVQLARSVGRIGDAVE